MEKGIWLQNKKSEELPESLIVQNPEIKIGYEEARAVKGILFLGIEK